MINKATLAKEINGSIEYIYPKTTADIVEYDPGDSSGNVSVQDKLRALSASTSEALSDLNDELENYYTKSNIDQMMYEPIKVNSFSVDSTKTFEVGTTVTSITCSWSLGGVRNYGTLGLKSVRVNVNGTTYDTDANGQPIKLIDASSKQFNVSINGNSSTSATVNVPVKLMVADKGYGGDSTTENSAESSVVNITFYYPRYYGAWANSNTLPTAAQIVALSKYGSNATPTNVSITTTSSAPCFLVALPGSVSSATVKIGSSGMAAALTRMGTVSNVKPNSNVSSGCTYTVFRTGQSQTIGTTSGIYFG